MLNTFSLFAVRLDIPSQLFKVHHSGILSYNDTDVVNFLSLCTLSISTSFYPRILPNIILDTYRYSPFGGLQGYISKSTAYTYQQQRTSYYRYP